MTKVRCAGCRRPYTLRADGRIRMHNHPVSRTVCPGARRPPDTVPERVEDVFSELQRVQAEVSTNPKVMYNRALHLSNLWKKIAHLTTDDITRAAAEFASLHWVGWARHWGRQCSIS